MLNYLQRSYVEELRVVPRLFQTQTGPFSTFVCHMGGFCFQELVTFNKLLGGKEGRLWVCGLGGQPIIKIHMYS